VRRTSGAAICGRCPHRHPGMPRSVRWDVRPRLQARCRRAGPGVARCVRRGANRSRSPRWVSVNTMRSGLGVGIAVILEQWVPSVPLDSSVTWLVLVNDTPIRHDHRHGRPTRVDENVTATAPVRPRPGTLAGTGRHRRQVPRRVRLRHRPPERRRHPTTDATAVPADQPPAGASRSTWPAKTATKSPPCRPAYSPAHPKTPWTPPAGSTPATPPPRSEPPTN